MSFMLKTTHSACSYFGYIQTQNPGLTQGHIDKVWKEYMKRYMTLFLLPGSGQLFHCFP
jgi:hypothetical protein